MKLRANKKNLTTHGKQLLGTLYTPEGLKGLIALCIASVDKELGLHISHSRAERLDNIGKILGTRGTEGMLLDRKGNDVSSSGSPRNVAHDIQYCNAGDTYAMTVFFHNGKLFIGDWGSIIERLS